MASALPPYGEQGPEAKQMNRRETSTQAFIDELVRSTGAASPEDAIRQKARQHLELHQSLFGEPTMPIDVSVLVGLAGIKESDDLPVLSPDAEIAPDGEGGVEMRVHPDRPETRKRFSIAHEVSHTFFPEYQQKQWCRTDARFRDRNDPDQYLEMLCDIGAAELLLPDPWFPNDASSVSQASDLAALALKYLASREATLRKFAEQSEKPVAAVFFSWKLKPTQKGTVGNADQRNLFGISPEEEIRAAIQLRIDYPIYSEAFRELGHFLPSEKSVDRSSPIYEAAATCRCVDAEAYLDFGQASGAYAVMAIPLPTEPASRGPNEEYNVAAILEPIKVKAPTRRRSTPSNMGSLFD
jgi:hypothetical protein